MCSGTGKGDRCVQGQVRAGGLGVFRAGGGVEGFRCVQGRWRG